MRRLKRRPRGHFILQQRLFELLLKRRRRYVSSSFASKRIFKRLARGIYVRYDCKKQFTAQELGEAKAKRFGRSITTHAAESAARLHLSIAATLQECFLLKDVARHSNPQRAAFDSKPQRHAVSVSKKLELPGDRINALWWLKKRGAKEKHVQQALASMNRVEREDFLWSHDLMPGWLSDLVHVARDWKIVFPLHRQPRQ